jgi:hypothetical protein
MDKETLELKQKLVYTFQHLDAMYLFRNEVVRDHGKRAILRFFFIQIDNLLKLAGRLKNRLAAEGALDSSAKVEVEKAIATLRADYEGSFDLVRDKLSAHAQLIDLGNALAWWSRVDYSTVEILYDDVERLEAAFRISKDMAFTPIGADYRPLKIPVDNLLSPDAQHFHMDTGRLGLSSGGAVGVIMMSPVHEKAQLVISTLDMIKFDFALTCLVEKFSTKYNELLFDAAWLLAVIDTCSLIDNLFVQSTIDGPSLLDQWGAEGFSGHVALVRMNSARDAIFEAELRNLRNKIAAHLDADGSFESLHEGFVRFDLGKVVAYVNWLASQFFEACRADIRTKMFALHGMQLHGVLGLAKRVAPFDDC